MTENEDSLIRLMRRLLSVTMDLQENYEQLLEMVRYLLPYAPDDMGDVVNTLANLEGLNRQLRDGLNKTALDLMDE